MSIRFYRNTSVASTFWTPVAPLGLLFTTPLFFFCELRPCENPQTLTLTGHIFGVDSVVYSPDGKTLASGSQDGTVLLWKTQT